MPNIFTKVSGITLALIMAMVFALLSNSFIEPALASTRVEPVSEGPYKNDREAIRAWLLQAKKRGVGINGYLAVYNDMENSVKQGMPDAAVKEKLDRISKSIGDQYTSSRKLQNPNRKIPKRGYSQAQYRGKVDITFGKDRHITPHEIKQSCEEAERQAWLRIPPHLLNDLEVRQDLLRQRDERERSLMRKNNFKERDFCRNPHRYRNYGNLGAGEAGKYSYANR